MPKTYNSQANFWRMNNKIPCSFCTFENEKCLVVGCRPKNISANNKQLLDEVFVISGIIKVEVSVQPKPKAEADNTNRDLDYSRYHKNRI